MKAASKSWPYRSRLDRGGGREYPLSCLPTETRDALAEQLVGAQPVAEVSTCTAIATTTAQDAAALTDWQRKCAEARAALVAETRRIGGAVGVKRAIETMVKLARAGELPEHLQDAVSAANARAGEARTLSRGSLFRWLALADEGFAALAPKAPGMRWLLRDDEAAALALYRQPNKPALAWCVRQVIKQRGGDYGSLEHRCRRALKKLPNAIFYPGRNTAAALRALQPFRRREFLSLNPNDVWVGDGHGAKLKVAHPITGNPFVPEVTAILDVHCRYCVGWSVALSENCLAVSDALRHGVTNHGAPLIYYSDNGGGQKNKMFDAPITGTLGALGIHHEAGRPGNPQGRGVIERFWQTVLISLAKCFPTYQGRGADRDTLKRVTGEITKQLRAAKKSEIIALPAKLPTWSRFIEALDASIAEYNQAHRHSSLPKLDGTQHATPADFRATRIAETGVELHKPEGAELATLFMPAIVRKAARGEVKLFNGIYFHKDLMLVDGEQVQVCYDIHDASRVWVKTLSGELIAEAVLNGNRDGYMPQPLIERLREQRAGRRLALLQSKADEVRAELAGGAPIEVLQPVEIEAPAAEQNVVALQADPDAPPRGLNDLDLYRWMLDNPDKVKPHLVAYIEEETRLSASFRSLVEEEQVRRGMRAAVSGRDEDELFQVAAG